LGFFLFEILIFDYSEQYDEMKSIVEAVFARMPGSVCKRDALLKWCGEKLANYVSFECSFLRRRLIMFED